MLRSAPTALLAVSWLPLLAQPPALFPLREMDLHLHSGMERPVDLRQWVDMAVADGRKVIVLIDHLELYRKTPENYEAWRTEGRFQAKYPVGLPGHLALMRDFDSMRRRDDVMIFRAWEISEDELDTGSEPDAIRLADMVGWHISPHNGGKPPDGQSLIRRVRQVKELQKRFPMPMVMFHPFPMRLENIWRKAKAEGRDRSSIRLEEYRFFQPGEQQQLAAELRGTSIYIEISRATEIYFQDPVCRRALIEDIRPLAELGVQFTISTDNHGLAAAKKSFDPASYCEPLGVTPSNTNTIVRDLVVRRAIQAGAR